MLVIFFSDPSSRWLGGRFDWEQMAWKWAESGKIIQLQQKGSENLRWYCISWSPVIEDRWDGDSCFKQKKFLCQIPAQIQEITSHKGTKNLSKKRKTPKVTMELGVDGAVKKKKVFAPRELRKHKIRKLPMIKLNKDSGYK